MLTKLLTLFSFFAIAYAGCDNACSGHGTCTERGICACYDNWGLGEAHLSGDCSQRICPYEISWVDKPDKTGSHHRYAECANGGLCNRDTGDCECFPGYEGKACQRTSCPNDCSGNGICTYIQNLPYGAVVNDAFEGDFQKSDPVTYPYFGWDTTKTTACLCDPEYGDIDCSKRLCPYGTDIMDQRDDMFVQAKYQVQHINLAAFYRPETSLDAYSFALTFKSRLNETFTTIPILLDTLHADFHATIIAIQTALESLPNRVIDKVEVHGTTNTAAPHNGLGTINITFVGDHVQGPQHPITVKSISCGDGCTPKLSGLELQVNSQNVTEIQASDFNSYECGRRGKCDYTTGVCSCFSGYTGLACNTITALV